MQKKYKKFEKNIKKLLTNANRYVSIREVAERNKIKATGKNLKRGKPKAK